MLYYDVRTGKDIGVRLTRIASVTNRTERAGESLARIRPLIRKGNLFG